MKRFISMLMAVIMIMSLVACGEAIPTEPPVESTPVVESTPTELPDVEIEENEDVITISDAEVVIVDNEYITFTVKGAEVDTFWEDYCLKVFIENKTDKTLWYTWEDVSVNGYMVDPFWATEIAAGKKENTVISFYLSDFSNNDIDYKEISDIEFTLRAYHTDENTWDTTEYVEDVYRLTF